MQRICSEKTVKRISSSLWNIEGLISCSRQPKSGPYESSSPPLTLLLYDPFKYYLPISNYVFQIISFLHVFPAEHSRYFSSSHACNMACPSHPLCFAHRNNMWKDIQIMTLLVTQLSTAFCPHPFNTSTYYLQNMVFHLLKVKGQGSSCKTN